MARTRHVPYNAAREQEKEDIKAARKAMLKGDFIPDRETSARFGDCDPDDDEFASVEDLVEWCEDDYRSTYSAFELQCLNYRTGLRVQVLKEQLGEYGLTLKRRERVRPTRGFTSNCHNRWHGCG